MTISRAVRERVRQAARDCCGYCRMPANYIYGTMEIEHIISKDAGGTDDEENLWLACRRCNNFKGIQIYGRDPITGNEVKLFNPRNQDWYEHFAWSEDSTQIVGITPCGRATVDALRLNIETAVAFRQLLTSVGWHPLTE